MNIDFGLCEKSDYIRTPRPWTRGVLVIITDIFILCRYKLIRNERRNKVYSIFTGKFARVFSKEDRIEEWIHRFLCDEGNNIPLSDGLKREKRFYIGPLRMPIELFQRCCGPEENMTFRIDKGGFEWRVSEIRSRMESGWDVPPLIINYSDNKFELTDGNHRYEAFIRSGHKECNVIIWITRQEDYQQFLELNSRYLEE